VDATRAGVNGASAEKPFSFVIPTLNAWNRSRAGGKVSLLRAKLSGT
jgi:hypothetical protein